MWKLLERQTELLKCLPEICLFNKGIFHLLLQIFAHAQHMFLYHWPTLLPLAAFLGESW